jgi:hypothetical protein
MHFNTTCYKTHASYPAFSKGNPFGGIRLDENSTICKAKGFDYKNPTTGAEDNEEDN